MHIPTVWKAALKRKEIPCQFCPKKPVYEEQLSGNRSCRSESERDLFFSLCHSLSIFYFIFFMYLFFFCKRELIRLRGDILPQEEGLWPEWRVAELNGPGHKCFWERGRSYRKRQRGEKIMKGEKCDVTGWRVEKETKLTCRVYYNGVTEHWVTA